MVDVTPQLKAFVIGPIGDRDEPSNSPRRIIYEEAIQVLEQVIAPACEALGIDSIRADQMSRTGEIPEQIFRQLRDAHLVIADLTGANPNVMYELGLRHTTGKLTVQIGERDRLPFDVSSIRTIMFTRSEGGLVEARRHLIRTLAEGLESGGDPVAATRVWFEHDFAEEVSEMQSVDESAEPGDDDEPGFLEKLADTEEGIQALLQALTTALSIGEDITRIFQEGTARIQASNQASAAVKLSLANRIAGRLEDPAARLRIAAVEYSQSVNRMEPGIAYLMSRLANEPETLAEAPEFPVQMQGLVTASGKSIEGTLAFKDSVENLRSAARSLRRVGGQITTSLQSIADTSARVAGWKTFIDAIPDQESEE